MVNVCGVPLHPFATGVTVIVPVIVVVPVFVAVNTGIFPEPLAPRPMVVLLFVQLNVVPATAPVKLTAAVETPLQTV